MKETPPRWVDSMLDKLSPAELAEEIKGDLYEYFLDDVKNNGVRIARRKYAFRSFGFLTKRFFWKKNYTSSNLSLMINSYFKMASRSLLARKGTAIINILGLVIGIAASLVILTVIRFETSFDSFHTRVDRIYRIVRVSGEDMSEFRTGISNPVPEALKNEIPALKNITVMNYQGGVNVDITDKSGAVKMFKESDGSVLADISFFEVFDFKDNPVKWLSGNPKTALVEPFSIVLTKTLADKYFGTEPALGQSIKLEKRFDCKVTGVIDDLPTNTDFPFSMLIAYSTIKGLNAEGMNDWVSVDDSNQAFIVLEDGTTRKEMEASIAKVHAAHTPEEIYKSRHYLLQPLSELHTDAKFGNYSGRTISKETLLALVLIGIFLLLTASINYINLSTAQSTLRAKEIGLRKVMGSNRNNLMAQFMAETFVVVFIAGVIALGVAEIMLINFRSLLNLNLTHYNFTDGFILLSLAGIILVVSIFAGLYPSLIISRFNPVAALKNRFATETFAGLSLRKVLVVVQFTITQILVVGTFIVVSQMNLFNETDMGFKKEAIVTARVGENSPEKLKVLEDQLRAQSFVENVSYSYTLPSGLNRNRNYRDVGKSDANSSEDYVVYEYDAINPFFLDVYGIRLLAGRNVNEQDTTGNILINKTLATRLGWINPEQAVGQELKGSGQKYYVVGVVADYYSNSLKEGVDNMLLEYKPEALRNASIKLAMKEGVSPQEAVSEIEKIWKANFPEFIFSYQFFDDNIAAFYQQEHKYAQLFQLFSIIFLLIGCLGLYGLITFMANRKSKEMAIRKVLGASINNILILFSREYVLLIIISFALAVPVAFYAVDSWLSNFATRVPLQWWRFTIPGLIVLAIALLVVTAKTFRTANANPVDKLKEE